MRGYGRIARPAFPAPSDVQTRKSSGKTRAHRREIAEACLKSRTNILPSLRAERSNPVLHLRRYGLLRFARNDAHIAPTPASASLRPTLPTKGGGIRKSEPPPHRSQDARDLSPHAGRGEERRRRESTPSHRPTPASASLWPTSPATGGGSRNTERVATMTTESFGCLKSKINNCARLQLAVRPNLSPGAAERGKHGTAAP
jgi:hypothetical protein